MVEAAYDSGVGFILYLQSLGDWLIPPMQFFSFIGREEFFLLLMPRRKSRGSRRLRRSISPHCSLLQVRCLA